MSSFNIKNSLPYQDLLDISNIPIYNSIKLNSTKIGDLSEVQEEDVLSYDGEKWIYSTPVHIPFQVYDSFIFLIEPFILNSDSTNTIKNYPTTSTVKFNTLLYKKGNDLSFDSVSKEVTFNVRGNYRIQADISFIKNSVNPNSSNTVTSIKTIRSPIGSASFTTCHNSSQSINLSKKTINLNWTLVPLAGDKLSIVSSEQSNIYSGNIIVVPNSSRLFIKRMNI
jgi:hypothetical protein